MILLVVEHSNGKVSKSTLEMTTAARGMGREGPITLLVPVFPRAAHYQTYAPPQASASPSPSTTAKMP